MIQDSAETRREKIDYVKTLLTIVTATVEGELPPLNPSPTKPQMAPSAVRRMNNTYDKHGHTGERINKNLWSESQNSSPQRRSPQKKSPPKKSPSGPTSPYAGLSGLM